MTVIRAVTNAMYAERNRKSMSKAISAEAATAFLNAPHAAKQKLPATATKSLYFYRQAYVISINERIHFQLSYPHTRALDYTP